MKYIKINENGIHIVFGITDRNQIKLLHFSKADFCEEDICKFGPECKAEDLARRDQLIDEAFQLVQVNLAGYDRPYEKHGNKHICTVPGYLLTYAGMDDCVNEIGGQDSDSRSPGNRNAVLQRDFCSPHEEQNHK